MLIRLANASRPAGKRRGGGWGGCTVRDNDMSRTEFRYRYLGFELRNGTTVWYTPPRLVLCQTPGPIGGGTVPTRRVIRGLGLTVALMSVTAGATGWAADQGVVGRSVSISVRTGGVSPKLRSSQSGAGCQFGPSAPLADLSGQFEVFYFGAPNNRGTLPLPAPWTSNSGVVAQYKNAAAPAGPSPVKSAKVTNGSSAKLSARGLGGLDVSSAPGAGGVVTVFTVQNAGDGSTHRMCSLYRIGAGSSVTHKVTSSGYSLKLKNGVPTTCPNCSDGALNGTETDIDCGGACGGCPVGDACGVATDCQTGICTNGVCQPALCSDGLRNGLETDIDCGGGACPDCAVGQQCNTGGDCVSGLCTSGVCLPPPCFDGIRNAAETDVDCGGGACVACPNGDRCVAGTDCLSGVCTGTVCQVPNCMDGVRNGTETDVDCGGTCPVCQPLTVVIDSPQHGIFSLGSNVAISGHATGVSAADADLRLNGTAIPLQANGTFSTSIPLSTVAIFNPIHVKLRRVHDGATTYDRVVVVAGASVPTGAYTTNGVGLRITDPGFDSIEPIATTLVDINPATFMPAGTVVKDNYCYLELGSLCLGSVDVAISGAPPPSLGGVTIGLDSQVNFVRGQFALSNLRVTANVDNVTGIPLHCELHLVVPTTTITGDFGMAPLLTQPSKVDVSQVAPIGVSVQGITYTSDCSGLLGPLEEALIGSAIGDLGALFADGMTDFLNQVDGNGNTAIAGAIETALAGVDIAGPVGAGLGININAPFTAITEDATGLTMSVNISATTPVPDPEAPILSASYHVNEAFPAFPAITPVQGQSYGIGLAISTSGFNQLLRSQIETGLLQSVITSIDLGSGPVPVTAGLLAALFPQFSVLPAAAPIAIRIAPTMAPVLTGQTGPNGELGELRMPHITSEFVQNIGLPSEAVHLSLAVDARVGLQLAFQTGGIGFVLQPPAPADVTIALLSNPLGVSETTLQTFLPGLIGGFLPELAGALQSFPLPQFLGLGLTGIEVSRVGQYYSIFANLESACTSGATCISGVCATGQCQPASCTDAVKNGGETAIDCGGGGCPACPTGSGCFLNTDCATGGCSGGICQPSCTVGTQCASGVCTGGFCRVPNCADLVQNGAETGIDCGGGTCLRCDTGGGCASAADCQSGVCTGNVCRAPTCTDAVRNGTETDTDCGGGTCPTCGLGSICTVNTDCNSNVCHGARCKCGDRNFTFSISSNNGGVFDSAEWPGGTASQAAASGCNVTISRPNNNIDLACTLAAPFAVTGWNGYSNCFGAGGEDGDGCQADSCPPAGIASCCSGRPSCSAALNGSGSARYFVQCLE
jgi:hypothetical protein